MAFTLPAKDGFLSGLTASVDLSAKQYYGVAISGAWTVGLADANGDLLLGVLHDAPESGDPASVFCGPGFHPVYLGGTVARGASLTTNASGQWIEASDGDIVGARAMEAGVSGEIVTAFILPPVQEADVSMFESGS